jgi:hypothetical protein
MSSIKNKKLGLSSLELTFMVAHVIASVIGFAMLMVFLSDFEARNPGVDIQHPLVFIP